MSLREKIARILTVPFFMAGICWFWIHRAFVKGMEWEAAEFPHLQPPLGASGVSPAKEV